jgi:hypothetical protein
LIEKKEMMKMMLREGVEVPCEMCGSKDSYPVMTGWMTGWYCEKCEDEQTPKLRDFVLILFISVLITGIIIWFSLNY